MGLNEDDVQEFVDHVSDQYEDHTIFEHSAISTGWGSTSSQNWRYTTCSESISLEQSDFSFERCRHTGSQKIKRITEREKSKLLEELNDTAGPTESVSTDFASDVITKSLKNITPTLVFLPYDPLYWKAMSEVGMENEIPFNNQMIPIYWFNSNSMQQTGIVCNDRVYVAQKQQDNKPIVDSKFKEVNIAQDNGSNRAIVYFKDDQFGSLKIELETGFTLPDVYEDNSFAELDLPNPTDLQ